MRCPLVSVRQASFVPENDPELNFLAARFTLRRSLSVFCGFCFCCYFGLSELLAMATSGSAHDLSTLLAPVGRSTPPWSST